jgi:hypothetical protein
MAIGTDYRVFFADELEDEDRTPVQLEVTGGGKGEDARIWLSTPPNHGEHDFIVGVSRREARELMAVIRVLLEEATEEDEALVGIRRPVGVK